MTTFAQRIRELRKAREWSVYDLASRLGVQSPGYVSKIEARGEIPSPEMVIKLAEVLDADVEELIDLAKEEKARELTENVETEIRPCICDAPEGQAKVKEYLLVCTSIHALDRCRKSQSSRKPTISG